MMRKEICLLAVAAWIGMAGPALAQDEAAKQFAPQFNEDGAPAIPADKRVADDAVGALQAWRGHPWWQVMAFCLGTWNNAAYEAEDNGDKAGSEALHAEAEERFIQPALRRLMDDRGIDSDAAAEILAPDVNFQFFVAGDEARPFAEDRTRCGIYAAEYAALARAVPATP
jgi:hypothetical protein